MADADSLEVVNAWAGVLTRADRLRFVPMDWDQVPPGLRRETEMWADRFLTVEAHPFAANRPATAMVHAATDDTPDLLRVTHATAGGMRMALTTSSAVSILSMPLTAPAAVDPAAPVAAAMTTTLVPRADGQRWRVMPLPGHGLFSTAPERPVFTAGSWQERVDAAVHGSVLSIILYHIEPSRRGLPDAQAWFPADFRNAVNSHP